MLRFVQSHTPAGKCPLAGNSVQWDRVFLDKHMSRFTAHLHYRIVDVSTVKELCKYAHTTEYREPLNQSYTHTHFLPVEIEA